MDTKNQLPFYPGFRLGNIEGCQSLICDRFSLELDGTNEPIYALNYQGHLLLNEQTIIPYIKFFFDNTWTDTGAHFEIINGEYPNIPWDGTESKELRKKLEGLLIKPTVFDCEDDGSIVYVRVAVIFDKTLYHSTCEVNFDPEHFGTLSLTDEICLIYGLPLIDRLRPVRNCVLQ